MILFVLSIMAIAVVLVIFTITVMILKILIKIILKLLIKRNNKSTISLVKLSLMTTSYHKIIIYLQDQSVIIRYFILCVMMINNIYLD